MKGKTNIALSFVLLFCVFAVVLSPYYVSAQSSSTNYRLEEAYFGTGGELDASSLNYRSQQSIGALGVGMTSSTNYDSQFGFLTQNEEFLEMSVSGADVNFGTLDPNTTSYGASQGGACNCSFYVRTYISSAYSVVTASQPPTSEGNAVLDAKATQGAPSGDASVEEFGINLRANTVPGNMGADLVNSPDSTFADGQITSDYNTPNQYKYGVGDVVAQSPATSGNPAIGQTNYTISYIAKSSNISAAGTYIMNHVLVVVPVY